MESADKRALSEALRLMEAIQTKRERSTFDLFQPYPKQLAFLNDRSRMKILLGGNQVGKTHTGSFELTCHLTGNYPSWWRGHRFTRPISAWMVGESTTKVRDVMQLKLMGPIGKWGTGMIPPSLIDFDSIIKKPVPYAIEIMQVKHASGGTSTLQAYSTEQGRDKFQGDTIDFIWADEEPPEDIDEEMRMRVIVKQGHIIYTMTPLMGITAFYDRLMNDDDVPKYHLTWDDVPHLTDEIKRSMTAGMSDEMKLARTKGVATIGTGKIIQFDEGDYVVNDFEVPRHWPLIGGLDIGLTHSTGAVKLRWDQESDTVYLTSEYKVAGKTAIEHAAHLKPWNCTFSISKDAFNKHIQTGKSTADIFKEQGLDLIMCDMSKGSLDASIHELRSRIGSGRFFIFRSCQYVLEELRQWRANDKGMIVKINDDAISALRYALMKLDKAMPPGRRGAKVDFTVDNPSTAKGTTYAGF